MNSHELCNGNVIGDNIGYIKVLIIFLLIS